jgi:hypothetical protein
MTAGMPVLPDHIGAGPGAPVPAGWTATTLGALGRYVNGRGFRRGEWCDAGRPIIRIQNLTGSAARSTTTPGPRRRTAPGARR